MARHLKEASAVAKGFIEDVINKDNNVIGQQTKYGYLLFLDDQEDFDKRQKRVIIARRNYWTCANMDLLADIEETGYAYLLSDGTRVLCRDNHPEDEEVLVGLRYASIEERKQYCNEHYGYIYKGDKVVIARGRKMKGETKVVNGFYRYVVAGTYGHKYTDYVYFTDGTKTNIDNCDVVGCKPYFWEYEGEKFYTRQFKNDYSSTDISIGGRL